MTFFSFIKVAVIKPLAQRIKGKAIVKGVKFTAAGEQKLFCTVHGGKTFKNYRK
jgi:hypothetical protein